MEGPVIHAVVVVTYHDEGWLVYDACSRLDRLLGEQANALGSSLDYQHLGPARVEWMG